MVDGERIDGGDATAGVISDLGRPWGVVDSTLRRLPVEASMKADPPKGAPRPIRIQESNYASNVRLSRRSRCSVVHSLRMVSGVQWPREFSRTEPASVRVVLLSRGCAPTGPSLGPSVGAPMKPSVHSATVPRTMRRVGSTRSLRASWGLSQRLPRWHAFDGLRSPALRNYTPTPARGPSDRSTVCTP